MPANKQTIYSDLAKVDAHIIQPEEYDEIPEMTDEDFARAKWYIGEVEVTPEEGRAAFREALQRGRPKKPADKRKIHQGLRLSPEVLERFKASGAGWQTRIDEALREWLEQHPTFGRTA